MRNNHRKEYNAWTNMKQRCLNKNNPRFHDYGGRGIEVDESWELFDNFLEDMGKCPEGFTLERKDNELGYSRENCKWASRKEQQNNQRIRKDNTSGFRGVWFESRRNHWVAEFFNKYIGSFKTAEEAHKAYANYTSSLNTGC